MSGDGTAEPIRPVRLVTEEGAAATPARTDLNVEWVAAGAAASVFVAALVVWTVRWWRERGLSAEERAFRKVARGLWLKRREREVVRRVARAHADEPPAVAVLVSMEAFDAGAAAVRAKGEVGEGELARVRERVFGLRGE